MESVVKGYVQIVFNNYLLIIEDDLRVSVDKEKKQS
jgi:hypothetical protein